MIGIVFALGLGACGTTQTEKQDMNSITPTLKQTDATASTITSTVVPTATSTPTPVPTATNTPVPTATNTPVPTATNTPVPTATNTPIPTATSTPIPRPVGSNFDFTSVLPESGEPLNVGDKKIDVMADTYWTLKDENSGYFVIFGDEIVWFYENGNVTPVYYNIYKSYFGGYDIFIKYGYKDLYFRYKPEYGEQMDNTYFLSTKEAFEERVAKGTFSLPEELNGTYWVISDKTALDSDSITAAEDSFKIQDGKVVIYNVYGWEEEEYELCYIDEEGNYYFQRELGQSFFKLNIKDGIVNCVHQQYYTGREYGEYNFLFKSVTSEEYESFLREKEKEIYSGWGDNEGGFGEGG